ncbi:LysR family transcriptional regulator [Duganella sp. HH105]|uniref:LysR family transcriptional regulator n=1 Tax=Duganella sp. HH105 TaxID=1781067 RepID=UPI000877E195|nr:LysR family transcriptional regulator [Duganella sp. HH105]OEZ60587.1 HTH-type transcriptional regulator PgrR [Duganella sp. HH105]
MLSAKTQYKLGSQDLEIILALVRGGTLAEAGERLSVDASTVFRSVQRMEKGLGTRLFERSRQGYRPSELALSLAQHGEQVEAQLDAARAAALQSPEQVDGTVRITSTDTFLHALIAPALRDLQASHPLLSYELDTSNQLANLTRHEADIAVRATKRPPAHLVGKHIGPIRVALFAARGGKWKKANADKAPWIAPDDALPEHPSVIWRKKHHPKVTPQFRVNSILSVAELVALGLGVGILPLFLARQRKELAQLGGVLDEAQTELWLLSHAESRHLRRVSTVFGHLSRSLRLD